MPTQDKKINGTKSKGKPGRKADHISLAPLTVEEAMGDLLRVRPQPKPEKGSITKKQVRDR